MRVVLVSDAYPPARTSGAVQMRDLSAEFVRQGHETTVLVPATEQKESWKIDTWNGVRILRLRSLASKDVGYIQRVIAEFFCLL